MGRRRLLVVLAMMSLLLAVPATARGQLVRGAGQTVGSTVDDVSGVTGPEDDADTGEDEGGAIGTTVETVTGPVKDTVAPGGGGGEDAGDGGSDGDGGEAAGDGGSGGDGDAASSGGEQQSGSGGQTTSGKQAGQGDKPAPEQGGATSATARQPDGAVVGASAGEQGVAPVGGADDGPDGPDRPGAAAASGARGFPAGPVLDLRLPKTFDDLPAPAVAAPEPAGEDSVTLPLAAADGSGRQLPSSPLLVAAGLVGVAMIAWKVAWDRRRAAVD